MSQRTIHLRRTRAANQGTPNQGPSEAILFISVCSALLALFVSLDTFIEVDTKRSEQVMESVTKALPVRHVAKYQAGSNAREAILNGTGAQEEKKQTSHEVVSIMSDELKKLVPATELVILPNAFRFSLPTTEFFDGDTARLKVTVRPLLERFATAANQNGLTIDGIINTLPLGRSAEVLAEDTFPLALARSSTLTRFFLDSGVATDKISFEAALAQSSQIKMPDATVITIRGGF